MKLTQRLTYLMAIASILVGATVADAGPSGAIFTTNHDGSFVNGNVYDSTDQVYLNGGPRPNAPCTAAGLPDGDYVFRVTNPSGAMVLSTSPDDQRVVRVAGGVIVAYLGTTHQWLEHEETCNGVPVMVVTVQLLPFDDTLNPGGEYKVWMTPIDADGNFEFAPSMSKTDNFKVVPPDIED